MRTDFAVVATFLRISSARLVNVSAQAGGPFAEHPEGRILMGFTDLLACARSNHLNISAFRISQNVVFILSVPSLVGTAFARLAALPTTKASLLVK